MTEHQDIHDPKAYTEQDYAAFEMKLFSPVTSVEALEEICMTLAHLPTQRAQALLEKFRKSARAAEVGWLECACDEGQYHYLSPTNEVEEREYLALKVIQELEDAIVDIQCKYDELRVELDKRLIEQAAVVELVAQGALNEEEAMGFEYYQMPAESELEEYAHEIEVKEKIMAQIRKSITTERYQQVDSMFMRHIHF